MKRELIERFREEMATEAVRSAAPAEFPALRPIPAARYTSPEFFALERERLWPRTWLLAAHVDEFPDPGHFRLWEHGGQAIVIVRGRDGEFRAFHNACRHRGRALVDTADGCVAKFVCAFHAWVYDLDGRLVGLPDEGDFKGLDKGRRGLREVRCERFGGWIYVNRDATAAPLLDFLDVIPDELAQFGPGSLRLLERHTVPVACNWKLAADAFIEVYHLRHLHPGTIHQLLDYRRTTIGLLPSGHSRMVTEKRPERRDAGFGMGAPAIATLSELPGFANLSYFTFPNALTTTDMNGFPCLQFWPIDLDHCLLEVSWFVGDWGPGEPPQHWRDAVTIFDLVLSEDLPNLAALQRGVRSDGCSDVLTGYQERRIHHFHSELDRRIGVELVPEELRVPPQLDDWTERPRRRGPAAD